MKVNLFIQKPVFKGIREDRNTVQQLKENNDYSLNEPNQRRINAAIDNLAKQRGEENIKFLLDVGENIKYQTNIHDKQTKNEWKSKLKNATEQSLAHSNPILREKYQPEIERVFGQKPLNKDEEKLLSTKKRLLNRVKDEKLKQSIGENLDYFVTSTETSIAQKQYILKRLDYFMSPKYQINPQLTNKKEQILSEMVNDITINTPDSKIPNIKAINQKTHGMCAAISIARKAVAYEDKPNYVDSLISELSDGDTMEVYDIQNLGSGKKVPVKKTYIDFDYAQEKGYRIVDASTLQWMNIGGMYGVQNEGMQEFNAFDKNNFDAFHDSFFLKSISDKDLAKEQSYYQALVKAKETIGNVKSKKIKRNEQLIKSRHDYSNNIDELSDVNAFAKSEIKKILPNESTETIQKVSSDILRLQKPTSEAIKQNKESLREYSFIPNEEESQKAKKVTKYFEDNYGDKLDKKALKHSSETIVYSIERLNDINSEVNVSQTLPNKIKDARSLYEAEAIYRASNLLKFILPEHQTDALIEMNIPDRETRILKGYDKVIEQIEKKNDKVLLNHFAKEFETTPDNKEEILNNLKSARESVEICSTVGLDRLFGLLGHQNRREYLLYDIADSKEAILNGNTNELNDAAKRLHIKSNKKENVIKEYDSLVKRLNKNPDDQEAITDAMNKMGYKDQTNVFVSLFKSFTEAIEPGQPDRDLYIQAFCNANGISPDSPDEDILNALHNIGEEFNILSQTLANAEALLEVPNDDGSMYFTVYAPQVIQKRLEKDGVLVPEKTMKKLQTRFNAIDKIRSSDEFASRQGKISKPELYHLSHEEKTAIKNIDKKINAMYSDVNRNLDKQFREIKEPLEKLAKYVGTNTGNYWVLREGESGLFSEQQVKIFEQLTDSPYRAVKDVDEAVDIIKNNVRSGVSGSSVFHDRQGGHAQYVVDIKTLPNGKDVLFHDNSWGASEHENIWVDSEGLTRTDYSDRRGGELGYITDDDWRNGNYVENLTHKKGHISPDSTQSKVYKRLNPTSDNEYDFSLMHDVILPGYNTDNKDIAAGIKDAIYIPDSQYVNRIEKQASAMSREEIRKSMFRIQNAGNAYKTKYNKIMERIKTSTFHKGIDTKEEFESLSDSDIVKVAFEKAALRNSYEDSNIIRDLAKANTIKDIDKVREKQRKQAMVNFDYAFSKTDEALLYSGIEHGVEVTKTLTDALKKHNIKVSIEKVTDVLRQVAVIDENQKKEFDGSLAHTIDSAVNKAIVHYDEIIPKSEESQAAKEEFKQNLRNVFEENLYFNKEDLKKDSEKAKGIRNWIDRKFNPVTDEEFVQIYRKLQDMPSEEFNKLTADVTNEELGIKNITGYDVLYRVKNSNSEANKLLRNTLFYDEYSKDMSLSKTKPAYNFDKLDRKLRGAFFDGGRTFDDLYRTMYFSMMTLDYEHMFNKNKDEAYRNYGALPAYPKMDLGNSPVINEKISKTIELINETVNTIDAQKNCIFGIDLANNLEEYMNSIPSDRKLKKVERDTIQNMVGLYITHFIQDPDVKDSIEAGYNIFEKDDNATIDDYREDLEEIISTVRSFESINTKEDFQTSIKASSKALNDYLNHLVKCNIPPKYHRVIREDLDNLLKLKMESSDVTNGMDKNRAYLELQRKIENSSVDENISKKQIDEFTKIYTMVNTAKTLNNTRGSVAIENQIEKINRQTDKYISEFIIPEKQDYIRANIDDWMSKELVGTKSDNSHNEEKTDIAVEKFKNDFKRCHLTSNPMEILDNFLLLSAADAQTSREKNVYKQYLDNELNLAKFVEIQDLLMEAVDNGNPAEVKKYFKEYNVTPFESDDYQTMDSDQSIDYMIRSLVMENNTKTAKMFVEKLGLGDRVMKIEKEVLKELNPKEKVDEIAKIITTAGAITVVVKDEAEKFNSIIEDSDNVAKSINDTKKNIVERTKDIVQNDAGLKGDVKLYLDTFDEIKTFIDEHPDVPRTVISGQKINHTYEYMNQKINNQIKDCQDYINMVNLIYKFLTDIHLPDYTKGYKIQQEILKDYENLADYNNRVINEASQNVEGVVISKRSL